MPVQTYKISSLNCTPCHPSDSSSLDAVTNQLPSGFYSTFRTLEHGTRVLGLRWHLQRLYGPAAALGLQPDASPEQVRIVLAGLLKDCPGEARVRLALGRDASLFVMLEDFHPLPPGIYRDGVRLATVRMHRDQPRLKSTAFIQASQEQRRLAAEQGLFEMLMLRRGAILEGLTSNFFYVLDGRLGTARRGILLGVTRRMVLRSARRLGLQVDYHPLRLEGLPAISEAFICSSSRGLVPVIQVDACRVGQGTPGPLTRRLADTYQQLLSRLSEPIHP